LKVRSPGDDIEIVPKILCISLDISSWEIQDVDRLFESLLFVAYTNAFLKDLLREGFFTEARIASAMSSQDEL